MPFKDALYKLHNYRYKFTISAYRGAELMEKQKLFSHTKFAPDVIKTGIEKLDSLLDGDQELENRCFGLTVSMGDTKWSHDDLDEFFQTTEKPMAVSVFPINPTMHSANSKFYSYQLNMAKYL